MSESITSETITSETISPELEQARSQAVVDYLVQQRDESLNREAQLYGQVKYLEAQNKQDKASRDQLIQELQAQLSRLRETEENNG